MNDTLSFSPILGRLIRQDRPEHLGEATRPKLMAALNEGTGEEALNWLHYLLDEHRTIHTLFGVWDRHMVSYYLDRCPDRAWSDLLEASFLTWVGTTCGLPGMVRATAAVDGRDAVVTVPGLHWDIHLAHAEDGYSLTFGSCGEQTERWTNRQKAMEAAITSSDSANLDALLDQQLAEMRSIHDVLCDWAWALLTEIALSLGEESLGDALRVTEEPWVAPRYQKLRDLDPAGLLQLTVEGMRGHFSGPGRAGSIQIDDEPDRFVLRFDACGTGGRMRRGDPTVGSGSRLDPPYNFLNVSGAYDWTWNRRGVCAYCAHCAVVNQILPIEGLGHPMRMTLYPEDAGDACRWILYKDPNRFPPEAYTDVGKETLG